MNVMLLSSYKQTNCWFWCQKYCIWCWYHQMHWRLNVMSKLLHSIVKQSNARWRLSQKIIRAASDADVIRCTDDCLLMSERLHLISNNQMHWRSCLIVRLLHPTVKRSDVRWRLSVAKVRWSDVFRDETLAIKL